MSDRVPIPPAAFEAALGSLDVEEFAAFVGGLRSATADSVDVDPPLVTVRTGESTERLAVRPATGDGPAFGTGSATADGLGVDGESVPSDVDAVVVAAGGPPVDRLPEVGVDAAVVAPGDLRRRLLYALDDATAEALCAEALGVPLWSTAYPSRPPDGSGRGAVDRAERSDAGSEAMADAGANDSTDAGANGDRPAGTPGPTRPPDSTRSDAPDRAAEAGVTAGRGDAVRIPLVVVGVVAVLLATAVGGAVLTDAGERLPAVDPDGAAGDAAASDADGRAGDALDDGAAGESGGDGSGDAAGTGDEESGPGDATDSVDPPGSEAARNAALAPTCERSALHVVQVQMNALGSNDAATNDGIRTAWRFASRRNRRTVGGFGNFVDLFERPSYAPMLSYDGARYEPLGVDGDVADVRVVTRENGTATARYVFTLRKVDPEVGAAGGNATDQEADAGCWRTAAVRASPAD